MAKVTVVHDDEEQQVPQSTPTESTQTAAGTSSVNSNKNLTLVGVAIFVIIGLLLTLVLILIDRNKLENRVNDLSTTQEQGKDEATQLVSQLSKYLELPTGETPTLATVTDVESLKTQQFFKNAQNGDKVLLYAKSGKAILYRPASKKIVDISSLATQGTNATNPSN